MKLANTLIIIAVILFPALAMAVDEPAADMEMLEFLGSFETARGKPVDPLGFADYTAQENKKEQPNAAKKVRKQSRKPDKSQEKDHDDEK